MRLLIISDTKVQKKNLFFFGFNSVVNEINYLSSEFSEIYWIATDYSDHEFDPSLKPIDSRVRLYLFPPLGGSSFFRKLASIYHYPRYIRMIMKLSKKVDVIHTRGPNQVSLIAVLLSFLYIDTKFWYKYATNWGNKNVPIRNRIERILLKLNKRIVVTINGFWPSQASHFKSFENPSIRIDQLNCGNSINIDFNGSFKLVFAGRFESAKGMDLLIEVLPKLPNHKIKEWVFLGDGPLKEPLDSALINCGIKAQIKGVVSQDTVHQELEEAHFLILPSRSEGFPKVISEAWNYGCIPISSDVGSIPQYLKDGSNGFLISELNGNCIVETINRAFNSDPHNLKFLSKNGNLMARRFTFEHYILRLKELVFGDN